MRILFADDDKPLCRSVRQGLEENGYAVDCVHDGKDALYYAGHTPYDLVILDVMMPEMDGFEVCQALRARNLRARNIATPVLMLTARDTVEDRVRGLDTGADDYLVKPFHFAELVARVRALLRRQKEPACARLTAGDLEMDTAARQAWWKGRALDLTTKELAILEYMMHNPDTVLTRPMIEAHVWDYDFDAISNLVDVYIRRIRKKIDRDAGKAVIATVRGAGYRLRTL